MYSDPRLNVQGAGWRTLGQLAAGGFEGLSKYQAKREAKKEGGRARTIAGEKERLYGILRYGDPESEEYRQAQADMEKLTGQEYRHQFQVGDKRAKRRVIRGKSEFPEARRTMPLASEQDVAELTGAVRARRGDAYASDQAIMRAEREAKVPMRVTAEELERQGKDATGISGKGSEWNLRDETYPGLEAAKLAARNRGGSGGGGGQPDDELGDISTRTARWYKHWKEEYRPAVSSPGLNSTYNSTLDKIYGTGTVADVEQILADAEAALDSQLTDYTEGEPDKGGLFGWGKDRRVPVDEGEVAQLKADLRRAATDYARQLEERGEYTLGKKDGQTDIQTRYGGKTLPE